MTESNRFHYSGIDGATDEKARILLETGNAAELAEGVALILGPEGKLKNDIGNHPPLNRHAIVSAEGQRRRAAASIANTPVRRR